MTHEPSSAVVDLDRHRTKGVRVFSGRARGLEVRKKEDLDSRDEDEQQVTVRIPDDTFAVTSSFFLGLFGPSIKRLGEDGFHAKYHFEGPGAEEVADLVRYAARAVNPLGRPGS